jgi:hypothetical protein
MLGLAPQQLAVLAQQAGDLFIMAMCAILCGWTCVNTVSQINDYA